MLYIEKMPAPARLTQKVAEIKSTLEWKQIKEGDTKAIRAKFDELPKDVIRKQLLKEQHYLCAYCMKQIKDEELHMTIEHKIPLSKDKERALEYNNYLGVCKGGADISIQGKRVLCCDGSKGNEEEMTIDPSNFQMMKLIAYRKDGTIFAREKGTENVEIVRKMNKDINDTLCLNGKRDKAGNIISDTSTCLIKGRRDAYREYQMMMERLAKKKTLTSQRVEKEMDKIRNAEKMPEFAGVILFFLNRKYMTLRSQGK